MIIIPITISTEDVTMLNEMKYRSAIESVGDTGISSHVLLFQDLWYLMNP